MSIRLSLLVFGLVIFPALVIAGCPQQFTLSIGNASFDRMGDVALDPAGRIVVTGGYFAYSLSIPGLPVLPNQGDEDILLAVFDPAGTPVWAKGFGFGNSQLGSAVATDTAGNIVLAGLLFGSVDFGGGVLNAGGMATYLAKFDPSGNHLWSQLIPNSGFDFVYGLDVAPNGDIVLLTDIQSPFVGDLGGQDIHLRRYDSDGVLLHALIFGTNQSDVPGDVATTTSGDVILTGSLGASAQFGGFTTTHVGKLDAFVAKIDTAGVVQWITTWGGTEDEYATAVAVAPDGTVYIGGDFTSADAPGLTGGPHRGVEDWFVAKFDPLGNLQWVRNDGGLRRDSVGGLDVSAAGDVVITGSVRDDFTEEDRVLVARYTADNTEVFQRQFKDPVGGNDRGIDVVIDTNDDMIIVGSYEGILDACTQVLSSEGEEDSFIMRMTNLPAATAAPMNAAASLLGPNYPNPFNPRTTITYRLSAPGAVRIDIFDVAGHRVRRLVSAGHPAGEYQVEWDGCDDSGHSVASGVYRYQLTTDAMVESRSMVLVR